MGLWLRVLALTAVVLSASLGRAEEISPYRGFWSQSSWWCGSKISPALKDRSCSLSLIFDAQGQCREAEVIYWLSSSTGVLEHLTCQSDENGRVILFREALPGEIVFEGVVKGLQRNLWGRQVLAIETGAPQGMQYFTKGRP
jgi:hypothetical protein